jgi:hypothetical protein
VVNNHPSDSPAATGHTASGSLFGLTVRLYATCGVFGFYPVNIFNLNSFAISVKSLS